MEHYIKITGSPELEAALRRVMTQFPPCTFTIESTETVADPAQLGFKLSKVVAIVAIVSGTLSSVDLTAKMMEAFEQSSQTKVVVETPQNSFTFEGKPTPEQRQGLEKILHATLK